MAARDLTIDQYAPLSHKLPLRNGDTLAPTWVPADHHRRLDAYKILAAYRLNVARHLLDDTTRDDRREYGDADLLVTRTVAGILGDAIQIIVEGADDDLPDTPDLPPAPDPLPDDATPLEQRIHAARQARWDEQATAAVDEWESLWAAQPALQARQQWLRDWADLEFLDGKIVDAETDAVGLGDGVYTLAWSTAAGRPVVDVYDPGFYFPVLTDDERGFPSKVHVAWEFEQQVGTTRRRYVRRLTWELVPVAEAVAARLEDLPADGDVAQAYADAVAADGAVTFTDTAGVTQVGRWYPWQDRTADNAVPSTVTCLFSDGTWPVDQLDRGHHVDDFTDATAEWATTEDGEVAHRLDLRIDFIPVVHIPDTPATREHFGRSVLDIVAQVLDDIHASDTDVQAAAALAAGPVVALAGGVAGTPAASAPTSGWVETPTPTGTAVTRPAAPAAVEVTVKPGVVWNLPDGGRMDVLDLSAGLATLLSVNERLLDRLSVNARVPAEVLGRVKVSDVPSGVALALAFGPFRQLIDVLRLPRATKYPLLLKMVQRLAQAGGALEPGPNPVARLAFGSFLPSDLRETVELAVKLLEQHGISRRTALRMLVDAGVDIGDLVDELARIDAEDTASALQLAEATGSEELAAERLGVELPPQAAPVGPPTVTLPTPPTAGGQ